MGGTFNLPAGERQLFRMDSGMVFARRGSWFGICANASAKTVEGVKLYIGSRRGISAERKGGDKVFMNIFPCYEGKKVDFRIRTTATEFFITTGYGEIRCCFAEDRLLYIKGEGGISLKLERNTLTHEVVKRRLPNAWLQTAQWIGTALYVPLRGEMKMDAEWEHDSLSTPLVRGIIEPDESGEFLLAVEESLYDQKVRPSYVTYEEALKDVTDEWEAFTATFPKLLPELEPMKELAMFTEWSFLTAPSARAKSPLIFMAGSALASSWQMIHNAVAMEDNIPVRNALLQNYLDEQNDLGQIPDFVDDFRVHAQGVHPAVQGWGLLWIMKTHDISKEFTVEELERLYKGYGAWADWFMKYRCDDGDGIPIEDNGDDSGMDDFSAFVTEMGAQGPDTPAYIALLMEAVGDLGEILGKTGEAAEWKRRSQELIDRLVKELWNGEMFIARKLRTHEPIISPSLLHYMPLVLGKRLPAEIIDRMTADLMKEGEFLTPWGLASEKIGSAQFRKMGMARGWVLPPTNLLVLTGMYDAGKTEEAKMIAGRYCRAMEKGFNMLIDPLQGSSGGFGCSWPVCAFLVLADMVSNM